MANILIVDDSPTVVQFVRTALERAGYETETTRSFVGLAARVSTSPPDAIVLDLDMPALSGMSVGRLIRKYQSRHVPVVIYSARPRAELADAGKELEASAILGKNGSAQDLVTAVQRALHCPPRRTG